MDVSQQNELKNISSSATARKKRNRVPLSCTICRKRRLRCDKQKPFCANCQQLNISHLCHYMKQLWAEDREPWSENDEISFLKVKSDNLNELIDISTTYNTHQHLVLTSNGYIPHHPNEIELNFKAEAVVMDIHNTIGDNKFRYNPSNNPVTILKSDPKLKEIWDNVTKLHEQLDDKLNTTSYKAGKDLEVKYKQSRSKQDKDLKVSFNESSISGPKSDIPRVRKQNMQGLSKPISESISMLVDNDGSLGNSAGPGSNGDKRNVGLQHEDINDLRKRNSVANMLNDDNNGGTTLPEVDPNYAIEVNSDSSSTKATNKPGRGPIEDGTPISKEDILSTLLHFLPSRLETELLLQVFFKYLYPSMPFLDSKNLMIQFHRIFSYANDSTEGSQFENRLLRISLSNYNDYCNFGIIILIIKLTEISFASSGTGDDIFNDDVSNQQPELSPGSELFKQQIPYYVIVLIEKEFIKIGDYLFGIFVPLPLIHFALLSRVYCESSNEVDNVFRSCCSVENIVQLALSFGLNIDPDNHFLLNEQKANNNNTNIPPNIERYKHTWRKTWYFIISLDVSQSLDFGKARLLKNLREVSDTKLPIFSNVDYVKNIQELIVVKNFTLFFEIDLIIIGILNLFEDARYHNVTKLKIDVIINSLLDFIYGRKSSKETLLTLDNLNIFPKQECCLRIHISNETDECYNLPDIQYLLQVKSNALNFTELERKLEIPRTSIVSSIFFVKHVILRHLIFELNWKGFSYFASNRLSENLSYFYGQELFCWTKNILEDILFFFNNTLKHIGIAKRITTPALLQSIFSCVQFLTISILKELQTNNDKSFLLLNSITRLLEKISKYNKRAQVVFDFIDNFNKIYLKDRDEANVAIVHPSAIQNVQESIELPPNNPQLSYYGQQYIIPPQNIMPDSINTFQPGTAIYNVPTPQDVALYTGPILPPFPVTNYPPNLYNSNDQIPYSQPTQYWINNGVEHHQINPASMAPPTMQYVSPYFIHGVQLQQQSLHSGLSLNNHISPYVYNQGNVYVSNIQRSPPVGDVDTNSSAAQLPRQGHQNFPGENNSE
ncbi:similar to Saccharomyces cerevisiae YLR256W HAP1 Zinc finger transcription factor involved in the complex regulation of gene expression in response to levels of heme and oxygen [Maudiozyma saulgeensis]|uniref:Similar to Saccharomyces cerevisiae YLR256W HAP1 Zinc finger transcription factor involved in the complex regulation of gene expression in response to levels of heme and oxygen n=1 Tax=Maudiozyma saulgeensis TaxID=1789683 RepID=A0A1X7R1R2_9SACH|nr:similar to Saccharomyces cerevisiae YLR256W HAP1 Zinc finger transcription factor involved in the complex regulation of gene expression in response to levels of heme and oxygen [Kazachstania saulgeensis]